MNTKAIGTKVEDIAASIAGVLKPKAGEMDNSVANLLRDSKKYQNMVAEENLTKSLESSHLGANAIQDIVNNMNGKTVDSAIDSVAEQAEKALGQSAEPFLARAKQQAGNHLADASTNDILAETTKFEKYKKYPQAYFNSPDKKVNHGRIGAVAGVYTGAAVGARYLSGGTLTTDSYGRKDIVGVPFL